MLSSTLILVVLSVSSIQGANVETLVSGYLPNWVNLDSRPLPTWYDEAKIGIFIHWGVFSVPSFGSEWFWFNWKGPNVTSKGSSRGEIEEFMKQNYKPKYSYQDFAQDFSAEFFNPDEWVDIFQKSGAKYIVLTSKHHEGYAMWPSKYSYSWNSMDVGPHRDIVGELANAVRKKSGLRFGLYHSLYEWFNPLYLKDKQSNFTTQDFVESKIYPEMVELVENYKPEIFWSDGEWEAPDTYWRSKEFLAWLYSKSPVAESVVVNDRWGHETLCKHGGYYTCTDRYNPGVLQPHKWENAMTIDKKTWGFNRKANLSHYLTTKELIATVVQTVACGGNILINVGPTKEGTIAPIFQDRLISLGEWLKVNGEAIYKTKPWDVCQNDTSTPGVWYTSPKSDSVYAIMLKWPKTGALYLACPQVSKGSLITMIGVDGKLQYTVTDKHLVKINLPDKALVTTDWGWVLKITHITAP